jgi:hypothetical protein
MAQIDENLKLSRNWEPIKPKVKRAARQSLAEWWAKQYALPRGLPPELRALLRRIEECEAD